MIGSAVRVEFIPQSDLARDVLLPPQPAIQHLPDWYRAMPAHIGTDRRAGLSPLNHMATNTTAKACSPLLDAFASGYIWVAQADIEVRWVGNQYLFRWRTEGKLVESHTADQHPGMPAAHGGADFAMKWECHFRVRTPPGYSTLFTHPLNRHDLPFRTFTGVVDTDTYPLNVNFPFQLIGDPQEQMIIEAGTPLCQLIPFRRQAWKSEVGTLDCGEVRRNQFEFLSRITRSYKSQFWHRKSFT